MTLPLAAENELGCQVLAEINPTTVELTRLQSDRGEPCMAVGLDGPREGLRWRRIETGAAQGIEGRSRFVGAEHETIGAERTRHNLLAHGLAIGGQTDKFKIVVIEHDRVIDRAERVVSARRNRETELLEGALSSVGIEACVDDEMIELQHQGMAGVAVPVAVVE